jgi:hypothetical protein
VENELVALANAGATALIALMASDSWGQVKGGFARLLAGSNTTEKTLSRLEKSQAKLLAARAKGDGVSMSAIEAEWRADLLHLLRSDPAAADGLLTLLNPRATAGVVYNATNGSVHFGPVIQSGQIISKP